MAGENPQTTLPPVPREPLITIVTGRDGKPTAKVSDLWNKHFQHARRILSYDGGIAWGIVNKAASSLSDLETRTHAMLQSILGWSTGTDVIQNKHISNANGKIWQDHVEVVDGNPHGTDHSMLDAVLQSDDTAVSATGGKHVTDTQVKKYEDHRNDTTIHHTLEAIQDNIAGMLIQGNAITLTYDDAAGTLTVALVKAAASADVASTDAGATYTGAEQTLINELKSSLNELKANLRTSGALTA